MFNKIMKAKGDSLEDIGVFSISRKSIIEIFYSNIFKQLCKG